MRSDMRLSADVRVELRVAGLPVGGHILAGLPGFQRRHRDGADHVPHHQLDDVQHLRVGVLRRMVSDQGVGQLSAVPGHRPAERYRDRSGELHQTDARRVPAGKCNQPNRRRDTCSLPPWPKFTLRTPELGSILKRVANGRHSYNHIINISRLFQQSFYSQQSMFF